METTLTAVETSSTDSAHLTGTHAIAGLIGTLPEIHFYQLLHQANLVESRPIEDLRSLWLASQERFSHLPLPALPNATITPLPLSLENRTRELRRGRSYTQYYSEYRFCLVPVRHLLTPQWYVNLDYLQTLQGIVPAPGQLQQALDFACDEGASELAEPSMSNVAGLPSLAFRTSAFRDLSLTFSPLQPLKVQRIDARRFAVLNRVEVVLKPNYLHVAKIGSRLLILNGVHRSLALMQAGWETIPCLLRDFPNVRSLVEIGFQPNQLGYLPDQLLLRDSRAAYLSDYLDVLAAPRFRQRDTDALWQFASQAQLNKQPMPSLA